jgi:FlaA1/EpsC-like NDP-sugar epimerase
VPALSRYLVLIPVIVVLWPAVLYFHGLYQLKRGRSRIDEFFAILFSVLIGTALLLGATLYVRVYYKFQPDVAPLWEYSQAVMALFVLLDVLALNGARSALRAYLKRMWTAGYNVRRVLVAGAGELGQQVAETILAHRELGFRLVGFVDDSAPGVKERGGIPVLGTLDQATQVAAAHRADQLYVALPLEEHAKLLRSSRTSATSAWTSRSCRTSCNTPRSRPSSRTSTGSRSSASARCRCGAGTAWSSA